MTNGQTHIRGPLTFGEEMKKEEIVSMNETIRGISRDDAYSESNYDALHFFRIAFQGLYPDSPSTPYIDLTTYDTVPIEIIEYRSTDGFYTFSDKRRDWSWKKMMATDEGQSLLRGSGEGIGHDLHDIERV